MTNKFVIAISNDIYEDTDLFNKSGCIFIKQKSELTYDNLKKINPTYVFFPHWSYIIPKDIHENFNCIIFHMTDLPFGRGGSPLQNLISRGIYETKISAIKCVKELDGGDIYLKREFSIKDGSANELYLKASSIISEMIDEIIKNNLKPVAQQGEVVEFKRRTPTMSNIKELNNLNKAYDYIRMLDAPGYPKAFLENDKLKYEFFDAKIEDGKLFAKVEIKVKDEK